MEEKLSHHFVLSDRVLSRRDHVSYVSWKEFSND